MRGSLSLFALLLVATSTRAQPRADVWVVPVANDPPSAAPIAEVTRQGLRDAGFVVPAAQAMTERFEQAISTPAPELSQRQIDEWVQRSTSAVRHLARADYEAARADLALTQELAESASEELNREASRARQVLDTCLYLVRAFVETGDGAQAERQARECRRLCPRVEPSQFRHTPEVRDLLQRVDDAIAREPLGRLIVQSEPSGCAVRLGGVAAGQTPFTLVDLAQGSYRVQVECSPEHRGRIHRVEVGAGETRVTIDTRLDQAIGSRPIVHARGEHAIDALKSLGRRLGISIVALEPTARGGWTGRLIEHGEVGERVALGPRGEADELVARLRDEPPPERARVERRRSKGWVVAGLSVAALGLGAYAGGIASHRMRLTAGDRYVATDDADPSLIDRQDRWLGYQVPTHVLAYTGGALLAAGLALALPERERTPWWAWLSGGAGLVMAAVGAGLVAALPACPNVLEDRRRCVSRGQAGQRMSFLASASPLLAVPLTYVFGRASGRGARVEASAGAGRADLVLRGSF